MASGKQLGIVSLPSINGKLIKLSKQLLPWLSMLFCPLPAYIGQQISEFHKALVGCLLNQGKIREMRVGLKISGASLINRFPNMLKNY